MTQTMPDPVATYRTGDPMPDLDANQVYQIFTSLVDGEESSVTSQTSAMTADECLTYLGLIPRVHEFDEDNTEWQVFPC